MNITRVNLHNYFSNYVFLFLLQNFIQFDVGEFWNQLAKMQLFFYYIRTDSDLSALNKPKYKNFILKNKKQEF